jgi:hypothetical protein
MEEMLGKESMASSIFSAKDLMVGERRGSRVIEFTDNRTNYTAQGIINLAS